MQILCVQDAEEMGKQAAELVRQQLMQKPDSVLGLATGATPVSMYRSLVQMHRQEGLSFRQCTTFNLDEYVGLPPEHPQSYHAFMQVHLFGAVDIPKGKTHLPDGMAKHLEASCTQYDDAIAQAGGIDLQTLGLGHNGHIGFNEPADVFSKGTHCVTLTSSTLQANQRFFAPHEQVPRRACTMGIKTIMQARRIVLLVSSKDKAEILQKALFGDITPHVPASVLQLHPDVRVITTVPLLERS